MKLLWGAIGFVLCALCASVGGVALLGVPTIPARVFSTMVLVGTWGSLTAAYILATELIRTARKMPIR